jgi:hypothetical protein
MGYIQPITLGNLEYGINQPIFGNELTLEAVHGN